MLRTVIEQYKLNIAERDNEVDKNSYELKERLREKEGQVRKLKKREREQQAEMKMSKSLSVDNTMMTSKLKVSQVSLGHIFNTVNEMKESNDRSTRLLGRKAAAGVK